MKLRLKLTHQIKLCPQKSLKKRFKVQRLSFSHQVKMDHLWSNALNDHLPSKKESLDLPLLKELRRSDFLFDGGYVGARAPLLSTSKIKRNKSLGTQFHTILKLRLLSFGTNVKGANTFLKRNYNSRIWNIHHDRFPLVFLTFSFQ